MSVGGNWSSSNAIQCFEKSVLKGGEMDPFKYGLACLFKTSKQGMKKPHKNQTLRYSNKM